MKGSVCAARVVSWIVLVGSYDPLNHTNQHEKKLGTGSGSDRPDCRVKSNFGNGPVAAAPGSISVAVASIDDKLKNIGTLDLRLSPPNQVNGNAGEDQEVAKA